MGERRRVERRGSGDANAARRGEERRGGKA
uniref:Uncharacterized protein n=1 Tax=Arundo donax TaxID=35708 RepID=A0A0A8Y0D3_ARUDO